MTNLQIAIIAAIYAVNVAYWTAIDLENDFNKDMKLHWLALHIAFMSALTLPLAPALIGLSLVPILLGRRLTQKVAAISTRIILAASVLVSLPLYCIIIYAVVIFRPTS